MKNPNANSSDLNANPIENGASKQCTIVNLNQDLQNRVKARREFILNHGLKCVGMSPGCSPKNIPSWYDPVAFARAQALYRTFGILLRISGYYGLMLVLGFYTGLTPLHVTGNSRTVCKLFTRYLSTTMHVNNWTLYDPFDPSSKAYRSLKVVRGFHRQVATKLNQATSGMCNGQPFVWMSQWGMYHAQFTFMGFMAVFPKEFGLRLLKSEDFHALFHFWRVIGYCLGIEDQYNLCSGTDEETLELCRQMYNEEWMPVLRSPEPRGVDMAKGIALSMSQVAPGVRYHSMMHYGAPFLGLDQSQYPLKGFWDYITYATIWMIMNVYSRSRFLVWNMNWMNLLIFRIAVWLRSLNEWFLGWRYDSKYIYEADARCPVHVDFNYKTAFDLKLH